MLEARAVTMRVMEYFGDENGNLPEKLSYLPIELIDRLIVMTMNKIEKPVYWDDIAGVEHAKTEVEGSVAKCTHSFFFGGMSTATEISTIF